MKNEMKPTIFFYAGIALVTSASIVFEILLTRLFSVILWYHFGFLVLSIAMLGIGLGGYVTWLLREKFSKNQQGAVAALSLVNGLMILISSAVLLNMNISVQVSSKSIGLLGFAMLLSFLPFFITGMCISLAFRIFTQRTGRIYAADLGGAAVGCLLSIVFLNYFGAPSSTILTAAGFFLAALFFSIRNSKSLLLASAILATATTGLFAYNLKTNFIKITYAKGGKIDRDVFYEKWNSLSMVVVYKSYYGKSGNPDDYFYSINIDSGAGTAILEKEGAGFSAEKIWGGVTDLVYEVKPADNSLIIGVGGGGDVRNARAAGVKEIVGVDINPIMIDLVKNVFNEYAGNIYTAPGVTVLTAEGRSFVRRSGRKWDVIQATMVDTWAASSSGAFALMENYLYTIEAFEDYIEHLDDDGVLSFTRWIHTPPSETLRLTGLAKTAWNNSGKKDIGSNIIIIKKLLAGSEMAVGTFLLKKTPFTSEEIENTRNYCLERDCEILYAPGIITEPHFSTLIGTDSPQEFFDNYPLNIQPTIDDRPFFFYFVKTEELKNIFLELIVNNKLPYGSINNLSIFVVISLIFGIFIVLLIMFAIFAAKIGKEDVKFSSRLAFFLYFSTIGIGYIMIEVYLLQKFILFLGHPSYALSVILFSLLLCSGIGSYFMELLSKGDPKPLLRKTLVLLLVLVSLYFLLIPTISEICLNYSLVSRVLIVIALIAPLGLTMGIPFPTGLKMLGMQKPGMIPWGWCFNGIAAVLGSALAVLLAITSGLKTILVISMLMYFICFLCSRLLVPERK